LALLGVVLALVSPWAPSGLFWPAMFLCYVAGATTLYLCRAELKWIYAKIRRQYVHHHKLPSDFWIVVFLVLIQVGAPTYLIIQHVTAPGDEDLRASFQVEQAGPNQVRVTYIVLNFGKHPVLLNSVGLYEVVTSNKEADAARNIELCDTVSHINIMIAQFAPTMMGKGAQVGSDTFRSSIYWPTEIKIDDIISTLKQPLPVEPEKTRFISALFDLSPDHQTGLNTLVLCPLVGALDEKNVGSVAVCQGVSRTISRGSFVQSSSHARFRILPHSTLPTCPMITP